MIDHSWIVLNYHRGLPRFYQCTSKYSQHFYNLRHQKIRELKIVHLVDRSIGPFVGCLRQNRSLASRRSQKNPQ